MKHLVVLVVLLTLPHTAAGQARTAGQADRLSLADAVALALRTHPSVAIAQAASDEAAAATGEAGAARWPSLAVEASATRFAEPMVVAPLHGFDPRNPPAFDRTLVQGTAFLGWVVFDGGARGAGIRAARASAEAAEARLGGASVALMVRVTAAYLSVLAARDLLVASDRRLDALRAERDRVDRFLAEGHAARVDLLRVEAALARALADSTTSATALVTAVGDLARLTGLDRDAVEAQQLTGARLAAAAATVESRAQLAARARAANPEVERARQLARATEAGRHAARARWLPELRVVGGYVQFGSGAGDFVGEWQAGVRVVYPLFTGGARADAVARADARHRAAAEDERLAALAAEQAVDRAVAAVTSARTRAAALAAAVEQFAEVVRVERLALDAGAGVQTDYLSAVAELFAARAALIEARNAGLTALVELARSTGDLSPAWLATTLEPEP